MQNISQSLNRYSRSVALVCIWFYVQLISELPSHPNYNLFSINNDYFCWFALQAAFRDCGHATVMMTAATTATRRPTIAHSTRARRMSSAVTMAAVSSNRGSAITRTIAKMDRTRRTAHIHRASTMNLRVWMAAAWHHRRFATVSMIVKIMRRPTKHIYFVRKIQLAPQTIWNARKPTFVWSHTGCAMVTTIVVTIATKMPCIVRKEHARKTVSVARIIDASRLHGTVMETTIAVITLMSRQNTVNLRVGLALAIYLHATMAIAYRVFTSVTATTIV